MGKFGAELMRRSEQWWQAVGDGWNGVRRFWTSFRRKPTLNDQNRSRRRIRRVRGRSG
jgi:hypothetical protein